MNLNPTSPSPILSPELNQLLTEHKQAETLASQWTARERELRQAIFNYCFPKPVEGTGNLYRLPFDKTLVGDYKINYMVDRGLLDAEIKKGLTSNVRPVIDKVISFDPKVRPGELKKLEREDLLLISPLITAKPGLPALEIKTTSKMRRKP